MNESKEKSKLVFPGCCTLSDDELAKLYKLDTISDEELASVSLERKSLINDYRVLHEVSMLRKQEEDRVKELEEAEKRRLMDCKTKESSNAEAQKDKELPGGRKYRFQLLNQLVKKNLEMAQFSLFMEEHFHIFTDYHTDPAMPLLPPQEREQRRFWAHCDYLENLYCNGGSSRAMNIAVIALIRFSKATSPPKAPASRIPRSRIPRPIPKKSMRFR